MKLSDLFSRLKQGDSSQPSVEWHLDPAEGIDFFLPDALGSATSGS